MRMPHWYGAQLIAGKSHEFQFESNYMATLTCSQTTKHISYSQQNLRKSCRTKYSSLFGIEMKTSRLAHSTQDYSRTPLARTPWSLRSNVQEWHAVLPRGVHIGSEDHFTTTSPFCLAQIPEEKKLSTDLKEYINSIKTYVLSKVAEIKWCIWMCIFCCNRAKTFRGLCPPMVLKLGVHGPCMACHCDEHSGVTNC